MSFEQVLAPAIDLAENGFPISASLANAIAGSKKLKKYPSSVLVYFPNGQAPHPGELIRFPDLDRSLKRPDIAIFCDDPPDSDEALDILPAAVIEILSVGYEEKDLGDDGAPFYLGCGVRDVLVVDPRSGAVRHNAKRSRLNRGQS